MKNRINQLFERKKENILSIYFTAGYPELNDTVEIIQQLEINGADLIEIGIPFSDPTADGPVIQHSNEMALKNGMSVSLLFQQIYDIRKTVSVPLILMGYFNPVMQYGVEEFCKQCSNIGIDGVIFPDLPLEEYLMRYSTLFKHYNIHNILLITPQTPEERIQKIDMHSNGFIYMVSSTSVTGAGKKAEDFNFRYFQRIQNLELKTPRLIGFGISDYNTFSNACRYANGAIVGSAFISCLNKGYELPFLISEFIKKLKN